MFGSILREEGLLAVLDDGTAGHNADKGILVVHDGDEILGRPLSGCRGILRAC